MAGDDRFLLVPPDFNRQMQDLMDRVRRLEGRLRQRVPEPVLPGVIEEPVCIRIQGTSTVTVNPVNGATSRVNFGGAIYDCYLQSISSGSNSATSDLELGSTYGLRDGEQVVGLNAAEIGNGTNHTVLTGSFVVGMVIAHTAKLGNGVSRRQVVFDRFGYSNIGSVLIDAYIDTAATNVVKVYLDSVVVFSAGGTSSSTLDGTECPE